MLVKKLETVQFFIFTKEGLVASSVLTVSILFLFVGGVFLATFIITNTIMFGYVYLCLKYFPLSLLIYLLSVYFIFLASFLYTTFADPGMPEPIDPNMSESEVPKDVIKMLYCKRCEVYSFDYKRKKRNTTTHCSLCGICILSKNFE